LNIIQLKAINWYWYGKKQVEEKQIFPF